MKMFSLKMPARSQPTDFTEQEVRECEDFCDPEREEILALGVDTSIRLDDGALVTRTA